MKSIFKKQIIAGVVVGCLLFSTVTLGAMTKILTGDLITKNPIYSAPKGYATTMGFNRITAKCTVSKSGYTTKSVSASRNVKNGGSIETDWVSGPTYASSGTKFKSVHTGYDKDGTYQYLTASKGY